MPDLSQRFEHAVRCRAASQTDAWRALHGAADGVPGVTVDLLGTVVLIESHRPAAALSAVTDAAQDYFGRETPIFCKERWSRDRPARAGRQVAGPPTAAEFDVHEDDLAFRVMLTREEHIGFFLDAREARSAAKAHAEGCRVLNLFAYTCTLGVAAARGGARSTTNVDLMRSALALGRQNYEQNGLPWDSRTFLCNEVVDHVRRARRTPGRYDFIIMDPPPKSRAGRGHRMIARRDYGALVARAALLLAEPGLLLLGHNIVDWSDDVFAATVTEGLASVARPPVDLSFVSRQADFPPDSDRPTARFLLARA